MIELNKIYNEDCLIGMKRIPDKSIDCIVCDLPYGTTKIKWDSLIPLDALWNEYERICKGAVILFSAQPFTTILINSNIKKYKYTIYWKKNVKSNFINADSQPLRQIEEINVFYKHTYNPQGLVEVNKISKRGSHAKQYMNNFNNMWKQKFTNYPSNFLEFSLDKDKFHPTQKPVALIEYLIKTYTNEGDTVLDNCMGSGTTAIACLNIKRKFIGFELNQNYYDIANERIKKCGEMIWQN
jgi:site-specific DNA-methyltransferase (adenine-specific)